MAGSTDRLSPQAFIAGSIAGAAGIFVGHPLDTLKTFAQTGRKRPDSVLSLFRGIHLQALVAGSIQSLHLGVYENLRRFSLRGSETSMRRFGLTRARGRPEVYSFRR